MAAPPIQLTYSGDGIFIADRRSLAVCLEHFGQGEVITMAVVEERSEVSHRQEFAWLREAWQSLPDALAAEYPSAEHLRKRALIRTGWCTVQDYPCGTQTEAKRWAAFLRRELDEYTIIEPSASVVRVYRARSQARGKMKAAEFQASKTAILEWVAALLEVDPQVLSSQGAGGSNAARVAA